MSDIIIPDSLVERDGGGSIVLLVLDGVGGLPDPESGRTELEAADTPNLDALASRSSLGLTVPVAHGVTPGSGPGHLALFGYDPLETVIGRGALSALGVGFDLRPGDVAFRLNLATFDHDGRVLDRRAGRPSDAEGRRVVGRIANGWTKPAGIEGWILHEKEHRAVVVLRGEGLSARIRDTDPQETGVPPDPPDPLEPEAAPTADLVRDVLEQSRSILADEPAVNGLLARGFARHEPIPSFSERFGLRAVAIAKYPMYRGVARLVGMEVDEVPASDEETVAALERAWGRYDYAFLHFKAPDARGEDGDFGAKRAAIEAIDALVPRVMALEPDVVVVTGDHATPATYRAHSWHHVPVLLHSRWTLPSAATFGERACRGGDLGMFPARELMSLALAHAGRLAKFGA